MIKKIIHNGSFTQDHPEKGKKRSREEDISELVAEFLTTETHLFDLRNRVGMPQGSYSKIFEIEGVEQSFPIPSKICKYVLKLAKEGRFNKHLAQEAEVLDLFEEVIDKRRTGVQNPPIHCFYEKGGFGCVIRKYEGSLRNAMDLPFDRKLMIGMSWLRGLCHLLRLNILHIDLHPHNLMYIGNEGKIIDFGLSMVVPDEFPENRDSFVEEVFTFFMGNPLFLPFREYVHARNLLKTIYFHKEMNADAYYGTFLFFLKRIQIFAMGVCLFGLFTKVSPFKEGIRCSSFEGCPVSFKKFRTLKAEADFFELKKQLQTHISQEFAELIVKMLNPDPRARLSPIALQQFLGMR